MRRGDPLAACGAALFLLALDVRGQDPPRGSPAAGRSEPPAGRASPLGINLSGVVDHSPEWVFVDVFKHSRPFSESGSFPLTPEGYPARLAPGQAAWTLMCREIQGHYPGGEYHCFYDGEGTIEFQFDAAVVSREPGHQVLHVLPTDAGIGLRITATNPASPIRNVRVVMPGFESTYAEQVFHPTFLERWSRARVLRFMDWQGTNNSRQAEWADRPLPSLQTQGGPRGVALEHMVALANRLRADAWFCMPHRASDDYVTRFATLVRDRLDPSLKAYVEYSNEVWNSMFEQRAHCAEQGRSRGLAGDPFLAALRSYSERSVAIFDVWTRVFGSGDRLVRVLAAQNANPWTGRQVMEWREAYRRADALAVAPYFGDGLGAPPACPRTAAMTLPSLLASCRKEMSAVLAHARAHREQASERGLDLLAYEGGQHLAGVGGCEGNAALNALFDQANRDAGMRALYEEYLEGWKALGGKTMVLFASTGRYTKWGRWGLLEWQDQDPATAPKYAAFQSFIERNPAWW